VRSNRYVILYHAVVYIVNSAILKEPQDNAPYRMYSRSFGTLKKKKRRLRGVAHDHISDNPNGNRSCFIAIVAVVA